MLRVEAVEPGLLVGPRGWQDWARLASATRPARRVLCVAASDEAAADLERAFAGGGWEVAGRISAATGSTPWRPSTDCLDPELSAIAIGSPEGEPDRGLRARLGPLLAAVIAQRPDLPVLLCGTAADWTGLPTETLVRLPPAEHVGEAIDSRLRERPGRSRPAAGPRTMGDGRARHGARTRRPAGRPPDPARGGRDPGQPAGPAHRGRRYRPQRRRPHAGLPDRRGRPPRLGRCGARSLGRARGSPAGRGHRPLERHPLRPVLAVRPAAQPPAVALAGHRRGRRTAPAGGAPRGALRASTGSGGTPDPKHAAPPRTCSSAPAAHSPPCRHRRPRWPSSTACAGRAR